MQFENSLGKLQCGSVTAPRKIIDMDVVPNNDPQQAPNHQQKDSKKTRQLLLEIERVRVILVVVFFFFSSIELIYLLEIVLPGTHRSIRSFFLFSLYSFQLYTMQLKLEDLTNPLALLAAAEQQQQQQQQEGGGGGEGEKKPIKETKIELIGKLIASFLQLVKNDKLPALLSIRKGKVSINTLILSVL